MPSSGFLEVRNLTKRYGDLAPVNDVSFSVGPSEIVGLIGPNGAGKSTLVRLLTGVLSPTSGRIFFNGRDISLLPIHERVNRGLTATFQIVRPFRHLSVLANVMLSCLSPRAGRRGEWVQTVEQRAANALEFCGIADMLTEEAASLSHGDLKRLELARALATEPDLLLLDEPLGGSSEAESKMLAASLQRLHRGGRFGRLHSDGPAMLIVEHKLSELMRIVDRVLVLNLGRIIADGPPDEVMNDPAVIEPYLGSSGARRNTGTLNAAP
jgi:branched-chain amino acid transport system ATP-binding protein